MNQEVSGKVTVFNFIRIIEEEMKRTNDRIRTECQKERRAVEEAKNQLLAVELDMLLRGKRGILNFLDNCGSIVSLTSVSKAKGFVAQTIHGVADIDWINLHEGLLLPVAQNLHRRLHPGSEINDDDVLGSAASWSFQDPPPPEVRVGVSDARLSLVEHGPRKSYTALRERLEREHSCPPTVMAQRVVHEHVLELNESGRLSRTVVRVYEREATDTTYREIEMDNDTWRMFNEWLNQMKRN